MSDPIRLGLVGVGKIAVDEHVPAIAADPRFALVATASPRESVGGVAAYPDLDLLLAASEIDAVAITTPPQVRHALAARALAAGKHVLLEKPPCATVSQLEALRSQAAAAGRTLFTAWHSQHAPAVAIVRDLLAGRRVDRIAMRWCEDVRRWHPGQRWLWEAGGLGVFDPAINALSILTAILAAPLMIGDADLFVPGNAETPIRATLTGRVGVDGTFAATLDFLQTGPQTWSLAIDTDRGPVAIGMGGAELAVDGAAHPLPASAEYPALYRRFAALIDAGQSEVDARPLALVADAFLIGRRHAVADFHD